MEGKKIRSETLAGLLARLRASGKVLKIREGAAAELEMLGKNNKRYL
jgi:hypothetical protein